MNVIQNHFLFNEKLKFFIIYNKILTNDKEYIKRRVQKYIM